MNILAALTMALLGGYQINLISCQQSQTPSDLKSAPIPVVAESQQNGTSPLVEESRGVQETWMPAQGLTRKAVETGFTGNLQLHHIRRALEISCQTNADLSGTLPQTLEAVQAGPQPLFVFPRAEDGTAMTPLALSHPTEDSPANTWGVYIGEGITRINLGAGQQRTEAQSMSWEYEQAVPSGLNATRSVDDTFYAEFRSWTLTALTEVVEVLGEQPSSWATVESTLGIVVVPPPAPSSSQSFHTIIEQESGTNTYRVTTHWGTRAPYTEYWTITPNYSTGKVDLTTQQASEYVPSGGFSAFGDFTFPLRAS